MRWCQRYATLALAAFSGQAAAELPCGTPERMDAFVGHAFSAESLPPPDDHLVARDSFSEDAEWATSARFVLKWGSEHPLTETQITQMLNLMEAAYDGEVTDWSMPDPTETGGTFFNVYIGDTGPEVPSVEGNGGYFTLDDEGYPYIVLNHGALGHWDYMDGIFRHEFFHAVQWASGAFALTMSQRWYWEATATWATGRQLPTTLHFLYWLPWYALRPTAALNHYSSDDYGGEPPDLHQYGAFILPWYISDHLDGDEVILQSWREGDAGEDPVDALNIELGEAEVEDVLADMAVANLTWDYELGDQFIWQVSEWEAAYAHRDTRYTAAEADEDDWWVHQDSAPDCYGYHYVAVPEEALERAQMGHPLAVAVEPDLPAGLPTTLSFRARLVEMRGTDVTSHVIDHEADQTWVDVSPAATALWLAVVNTTPPHALRDTPAYRFRWIPLPEPEDTGAPEDTGSPVDTGETVKDTGDPVSTPTWTDETTASPKGCACSSSRAEGLLWLAPLLLLCRRRGDSPTG